MPPAAEVPSRAHPGIENRFAPRRRERTAGSRLAPLFLTLSLLWSGCRLPDVNLATSEPLKVDINVDLNVYQHSSPEAAAAADAAEEAREEIEKRKYNRASEIQELKNQRYVAETHRGLLLLRQQPAGNYGNYVRDTVEAENTDRMKLMTADAAKERRSLQELMTERYQANFNSAHPGEWVEIPDPGKPDSWKLAQKP